MNLQELEAFLKERGVRVWFDPDGRYIRSRDLLPIFEKSQKVYGHLSEALRDGSKTPAYWGPHENNQYDDTHTALLINIQPITPKSTEQEAIELLNEARAELYTNGKFFELACKLDDFLKKVSKP